MLASASSSSTTWPDPHLPCLGDASRLFRSQSLTPFADAPVLRAVRCWDGTAGVRGDIGD